jgi:hypothetical protein
VPLSPEACRPAGPGAFTFGAASPKPAPAFRFGAAPAPAGGASHGRQAAHRIPIVRKGILVLVNLWISASLARARSSNRHIYILSITIPGTFKLFTGAREVV